MNFKCYTVLLLILGSYAGISQNVPAINSQGNLLEDFVPENWKLIATASGDLNKDKVRDGALVVQEMDPKKVVINDGIGIDTLDTNPRILIIVFRDSAAGVFRLKDVSRTFILNHFASNMDDPFDGIMISDGILQIGFHFWYSAGSWYQTTLEYKFRFQKNEFYLIGAEFNETHRATMESVQRSFNFSTKKMRETKITYESIQEGAEPIEKTSVEWKNLKIEMKTLKTLKEPMSWTVAQEIVI